MSNKIKKRYNRIASFYDILNKPMEMALSSWRMDAFNFVPLHLYGANINRETFDNLLKAGFPRPTLKLKMFGSIL